MTKPKDTPRVATADFKTKAERKRSVISVAAARAMEADWTYWSKRQTAELWQAVALSLDKEPTDVERVGNPEDLLPHADEMGGQGFISRMEVAADSLGTHGHLRPSTALGFGEGLGITTEVDLRSFGAWAQRAGWSLPARFPRSAAAAQQELVRPLQQAVAQEDAILRELERQAINPLRLPAAPSGKPGVPAQLRTLLKVGAPGNQLFVSKVAFEKAWGRLTKDGRLKYSD